VVALASAESDAQWIGDGWLDHLQRVEAVEVTVQRGPVYAESRILYLFEGDRRYEVRVRLYAERPYLNLKESFNLGAPARFVFNYGSFPADKFIRTKDGGFDRPASLERRNAAQDFIRVEGQDCLARLVIWNQFGYFGGKQDNIGLITEDDRWALGGFLIRPDRWTRAKVNHVDLYRRPQVPGDRLSRGVVGLEGAEEQIALEAWLVDGQREWGLYLMSARDREAEERSLARQIQRNEGRIKKEEKRGKLDEAGMQALKDRLAAQVEDQRAKLWLMTHRLRTLHTREGIWPLDRLNRLTLVWKPDGSKAPPAQQILEKGIGGGSGQVDQWHRIPARPRLV
jgi:hypothetical protein